MTFLIAGYETTSLLLTWAIMLLATNPLCQDRVRTEATKLSNAKPNGKLEFDDTKKMRVLNSVLQETLRLYPLAAVFLRTLLKNIKLEEKLVIPKGLSIWILIVALHHDKYTWGENADEFHPSRFE